MVSTNEKVEWLLSAQQMIESAKLTLKTFNEALKVFYDRRKMVSREDDIVLEKAIKDMEHNIDKVKVSIAELEAEIRKLVPMRDRN